MMMSTRAQLALVLTIGLPACGGDAPPRETGTETADTTATDAALTGDTPSGATQGGTTTPAPGDASGTDTAVASSSEAGASDDATGDTTTGPEPTSPIVVAVISDLNGSYGSTTYQAEVHAATAALVALAPDVVLSTGDMVAGQQAGLDYAAMWAGFHAAVSDPLAAAAIPFAVSPGNHDASAYASFADERQIYVDQWAARKPELEWLDDTAWPLYYSFTRGAALFVALDSTTIGPLPAAHMAWIEDQLVAGADHPVKILYGHVPLYPFAQGREDEVIGDPALEAMLGEHDVTMFVSGHHHAYYPGRRGDLGLVGMACLGSGPRALIGEPAASARSILRIEISGSGAVEVLDAFSGAAFDQPIARDTLPESLTYGGVTIVRDDLR